MTRDFSRARIIRNWLGILLMGVWASGCSCGGEGGGESGDDNANCAVPCRQGTLCCENGQECIDDLICAAPCAGTRCGDHGAICCAEEQACLDGVLCAATCEEVQLTCGEDLNICCASTDVCLNDGCVEPGTSCADDFDCAIEDGKYCETVIGRCLDTPENVSCELPPDTDPLDPTEEWHWPGVEIGGKLYENVIASPAVGDVSGDGIPDVVVPVYAGSNLDDAILVALSGKDGTLLFSIGGANLPDSISPVALGDFDPTDEALEIIYTVDNAGSLQGGLRIVDGDGTTELGRRVSYPGVSDRIAPAVADLNADGTPDVVAGCNGLNGKDIGDASQDIFSGEACEHVTQQGAAFVAVANLDADPAPEVTSGAVAYNVDGSVLWRKPVDHGFSAIADLNLDGDPEVVVISSDPDSGRFATIVVRDGATGNMLIGPGGSWSDARYDLPVGVLPPGQKFWNIGGPPTVADFDGDGLPEIAAASQGQYIVFDPDCLPSPPRQGGAACGSVNFILWQANTQDYSSSATGSSVFDFQGDGAAEVIYNDECFLHIYNGRDGTEALSEPIPNSTRTAIEYPLVVDVDGDGNSEIVVPANRDKAVGRDKCQNAYAALYGVPASELPDAIRTGTSGIYVFGDTQDRWVRTRPIWNQHTYHVSNVTSTGQVPQVEQDNWTVEGLNNYRQNVQGGLVLNGPNLQVELDAAARCTLKEMSLSAKVTNVGARGVAADIAVAFYSVVDDEETEIGSGVTTRPLLPGGTERITLIVEDIDVTRPLTFRVKVDVEGGSGVVRECREDDNVSEATASCALEAS